MSAEHTYWSALWAVRNCCFRGRQRWVGPHMPSKADGHQSPVLNSQRGDHLKPPSQYPLTSRSMEFATTTSPEGSVMSSLASCGTFEALSSDYPQCTSCTCLTEKVKILNCQKPIGGVHQDLAASLVPFPHGVVSSAFIASVIIQC